jgi:hypothetical protein
VVGLNGGSKGKIASEAHPRWRFYCVQSAKKVQNHHEKSAKYKPWLIFVGSHYAIVYFV